MKKTILSLFICLFLLTITVAFVSCGGITSTDTDNNCEHVLAINSAISPTCTNAGKTEGSTCTKCGEIITQQYEIVPLGHNLVVHSEASPTCDEKGHKAYESCTRCDYKTNYTEIEALGHDMHFVETKAPTCETKGYDLYECSRCDYEVKHKEIAALGHDMELVESKAPTCETKGYKLYECSRCNYSTEKEKDALEHDMQFVETVKATCQEGGYDTYACTRCEETERRHETEPSLAPDAHSYIDEGSPATCIASGFKDFVCELCGTYSGNREIIPALGHTYERDGYDGTGKVQTAPACEENGYIVYTCTEEGCVGNAMGDGPATWTETYEDMVDADKPYAAGYKALGHDMQFVETVKATCQEGGYDTYACTRCEETERRHETAPSFAPDAHSYIDVGSPATCIASGFKDLVCELCGTYSGNRKIIPALGHTYERDGYDGTGKVQTTPTCEENGFIVYTCTEEGCVGNAMGDGPATKTETYEDMVAASASYANDFKALGHNYNAAEDGSNVVENVVPTCTTPGYVVYSCQNGCGTTSKVTEGYEALTHTYERNPDKTTWTYEVELEPTCITEGLEWAVCTDCGHNTKNDAVPNPLKYSQPIAATGAHIYDMMLYVILPTCTEPGYTIYGCSADVACAATVNRDVVNENGHAWTLDMALLDNGMPTCKTGGDWPYYCDACEETCANVNGEVSINVRHEGYTPGDFYIEPTCISRGYYLCLDCETVFEAYADDVYAAATGAHTYNIKGETTPSTCSEYGYTTYYCSNDVDCTATERRNYTALTAHSYSNPAEDGTIYCLAGCEMAFRDVTTAVGTRVIESCICGNKGTEACTCSLKVEFIATKVPDAAFNLSAGVTFEKDDFDDDCGPALIVLKGKETTTYTIAVYDDNGDVITTYSIYKGTDDANVVIRKNDAYVNLIEIAGVVDKVVVTASTAATVQMYYPV